jgi:hypothetical protein
MSDPYNLTVMLKLLEDLKESYNNHLYPVIKCDKCGCTYATYLSKDDCDLHRAYEVMNT